MPLLAPSKLLADTSPLLTESLSSHVLGIGVSRLCNFLVASLLRVFQLLVILSLNHTDALLSQVESAVAELGG